MSVHAKWAVVILMTCLAATVKAVAAPGEDGNVTITGNVQLNRYTTLGTGAAAGSPSITVASVGALAFTGCPTGATCSNQSPNGFVSPGPLALGDMLLIYQPQDRDSGAITTADNASFGAVVSYGQAGLYEFVYVRAIDGNRIDIVTSAAGAGGQSACNGLTHGYDAGAMVVRVPQLNNLTINAGGVLTAPAWDGATGGVVAVEVARTAGDVGGVLAFNDTGRIDVSRLGFRGGQLDNEGVFNTHVVSFANDNCTQGGRKGESIFGFSGTTVGSSSTSATCSFTNNATGLHVGRAFGRGALANGGGGGNAHNAGGGGGGNGGSPQAWNGGGNPASGFNAQWQREFDALSQQSAGLGTTPGIGPLAVTSATLGALNASTGGGRGGYSYSTAASNASRNPATEGPQLPPDANCGRTLSGEAWGGNCRANVGGVGGRPLDRDVDGNGNERRIYFGGGGGAGDANNGAGGAGGRGGGVAFVVAFSVTATATGTRGVYADGEDGGNTSGGNNDAAGGGGAGGTIVLTTNNSLPALTFSAAGGRGGNQGAIGNEAEGPGGGGGGGGVAVRSLSALPVANVAGGVDGGSSSTLVNGTNAFPPNGATRGGAGVVVTAPSRNAPMFQCVNAGCNTDGCFTTPVTNAWFESVRSGREVRVRFSTAAEVANAGFWIEGASGVTGERGRKLSRFIPAKAADPASPRSYEVVLADTDANFLWLVDVDMQGRATRRGPYAVGARVGREPQTGTYAWSQAEVEATQARRLSALSTDAAYLTVGTAGMHRVTHEALVAAGVNLAGTPAAEIAVLSRSGAVARAVRGGAVFGPGSVVEFHGDPSPDLYSREERYVLTRTSDPGEAIDISVSTADWGGARGTSLAVARAEHVPPRWHYEPASPGDSPWYQYELTAGPEPVGLDMPIAVAHPAGTSGTLKVKLYGGIDVTDGAAPDHSVRILFNGVAVASRRFDGITAQVFEAPVTNVVAGTNVVRVELPFDTGYDVDQVVIESASLEYATTAEVRAGRFQAAGVTTVATLNERVFVDGLGDAIPDCVQSSGTGPYAPSCIPIDYALSQVAIANRSASDTIWIVSAGSVRELRALPGSGLSGALADSPGSTIIVANRDQLPQPVIEAAPALAPLPSGQAEYVVVAHPAFAGAVAPLVAHRQAQGLSTAVIDVEQLYRRYTAGNAHPDAIRAFMREHAAALGMRYLVLAGGANYNSVGLIGGSVSTLSHIPTPYVPVNQLIRYAPGDAQYGDLTGDLVAEVAVGRLPVRTVAEATEAVRKIIAYETQGATNRIALVSGGEDTALGLDFRAAVGDFAATLSPAWTQSRIDVDVLGAAAARQSLLDALANGASLISYTGHSGPQQWGFEPLLTADQVAAFPPNPNQPFLLQFGCWTTYFLSPEALTMGNAWMLTPNTGASGVLGSTVLLDQPNHDRMAAALGPRLVSGRRLGDVVEAARRELAADMPLHGGSEILAGIALLGDPAMVLR